MALSLLDDQFFYNRKINTRFPSILSKVFNFLVYGALLYGVVTLYSLKIKESHIEARIGKRVL